jgi:hypothetical protein
MLEGKGSTLRKGFTMAKPVRSSRRKSSGKRSPSTQDLRVHVTDVKGSTDGKFGVSAVPTHKPQFKRRPPRLKSGKHGNLTVADIESLPSDALVAVDGAAQAKLALYNREAQPREARGEWTPTTDTPDYTGFSYE